MVIPAAFLFFSPVEKLIKPQAEIKPAAAVDAAAAVAGPPIVMVIFDELPLASLLDAGGRIDAARYPAFAELARTSDWFRNTTSVSDFTRHAIPAIVSGRYPRPGSLPIFRDHKDNIFTLLGPYYRLNVHEPITRLCPVSLCRGRDRTSALSRGAEMLLEAAIISAHLVLPGSIARELLSDVEHSWKGIAEWGWNWKALFKTGNRTQQFQEFIESIDGTPEQTFHFHHAVLPHEPLRYTPSGRSYRRTPKGLKPMIELKERKWPNDAGAVRLGYQRHLLQLGYADRLLGLLLAKLRASRLFDRSLIVVSADHGVSFRPGDYRRRLTEENMANILMVPLLVKLPRQNEGVVSDRAAQTIDIVPTIAAVLGIGPGPAPHGRNLYAAGPAERPRKAYYAGAKKQLSVAADLRRRMRETLQWKLALFGDGAAGRGGLYASPAYKHLLGVQPGQYRRPSGAAPFGRSSCNPSTASCPFRRAACDRFTRSEESYLPVYRGGRKSARLPWPSMARSGASRLSWRRKRGAVSQ